MTTQLQAVIEKSTQPKPRKEEIIAAMALVKRQQQVEEAEKQRIESETLSKRSNDAILKYFLENQLHLTPEVSIGYRSQRGFDNVEVAYKISSVLPKHIIDLMVKSYDASRKHVRVQDLIEIRKEIRDKMANRMTETDRIKALTETPAVRKALVKMLDELNSPSIPV